MIHKAEDINRDIFIVERAAMPHTWFVVRWTLYTEGLVVDRKQESWFDGREDAAEYTDEIVAKFKGAGQRLHIWTETVIV